MQEPRKRNTMRYFTLAAVLAVAASAGAAYSTADGAGSHVRAQSASSGINIQGAKKDLAAIVASNYNLNVPKLNGPIPKNKTINVINCPIAICTEVASRCAAGHEGSWLALSERRDERDASGLLAGLAADRPVPRQRRRHYGHGAARYVDREDIKKANVPVVPIVDNSPPSGLVKAVIASSANVKEEGAAEGNWVVQDAGKPVNAVFVYDPSVTSIASAYPGFLSAVQKNCSACTVGVLKVSVLQIGPTLAQQVVSYLQANPNVSYVAFGLGDFATGVPAAIKAAGLENQVKLVTRAVTPTNYPDIQSGGIAAGFTSEIYETSFWALNTILRVLDHKSIRPYVHENIYLFTPRHLPANLSVPYSIPGYVSQFKKAWGVS